MKRLSNIKHLPHSKMLIAPLGTWQSVFYNMASAKRKGATTFFELVHNVHNWVNTNMNGLERGNNFLRAQDKMNF